MTPRYDHRTLRPKARPASPEEQGSHTALSTDARTLCGLLSESERWDYRTLNPREHPSPSCARCRALLTLDRRPPSSGRMAVTYDLVERSLGTDPGVVAPRTSREMTVAIWLASRGVLAPWGDLYRVPSLDRLLRGSVWTHRKSGRTAHVLGSHMDDRALSWRYLGGGRESTSQTLAPQRFATLFALVRIDWQD